jgi:hypothetical protein
LTRRIQVGLAVLLVGVISVSVAYWQSDDQVSVSGTLQLPKEWGDIDRTLELMAAEDVEGADVIEELRSIDELLRRHRLISGSSMRIDPTVEGLFHWAVSGVDPGVYVLRSTELTLAQRLDVGRRGVADVRFRVPPPAHVEVEVISLDSEDLSVPQPIPLRWTCTPPSVPWQEVKPQDARWNEGSGCFQFTAPAGEVEFDVDDFGAEIVRNRVVTLRPGANRITIGLRKGEE